MTYSFIQDVPADETSIAKLRLCCRSIPPPGWSRILWCSVSRACVTSMSGKTRRAGDVFKPSMSSLL